MPSDLRLSWEILPTSEYLPLGARGARPVVLTVLGAARQALVKELTAIPGVKPAPAGVSCAWDAVPAVAAAAGIAPPEPPVLAKVPLPGMQRYRALGFDQKLRDYQKEMIRFLVRRAWAVNALPMRAGKTLATLAAAEALGVRKTLIVCPALAKWVWADEIRKWCGETSLVLEGRGADEARLICLTCAGTGDAPDGSHCPTCRAKNGSSYGYRLFREPDEIDGAINAARWVIVNPDLLVSHRAKTNAGVKFVRQDLPGWAPTLARVHFDLAIPDEGHLYLCGRSDLKRKGQTRRERFVEAVANVPRVWAVTGTPIRGYLRDVWGLADSISNGLYGRPFFTYDVRYCHGHKGEYGWENTGSDNEDELRERMRFFMLKRSREEILKDQPRKVRQVVHLDIPGAEQSRTAKSIADKRGAMFKQLRRTAAIKADAIVDSVVAEVTEGGKVFKSDTNAGGKAFVLTYLVESAVELGKKFGAALTSKEWGPQLRRADTRVWCVHGGTDSKLRFAQAQAFREWKGAGIFVATIDSMQVALSLKGAQSVHFADLTWEPHAMLQAEDRPFEVGVKGLTILYYVVRGSIDEHVEALVLPKMRTLEEMSSEQGAREFREAFTGTAGDGDLADQIWERMSRAAAKAAEKEASP